MRTQKIGGKETKVLKTLSLILCLIFIVRYFYNHDVLEDVIYNKVKDFDLILSGHTHGGLVPDCFIGNKGLISPERKWFPKNVSGHIIRENTHLIINSATVKFSNTSHSFKYLNFLYSSHINSINFK